MIADSWYHRFTLSFWASLWRKPVAEKTMRNSFYFQNDLADICPKKKLLCHLVRSMCTYIQCAAEIWNNCYKLITLIWMAFLVIKWIIKWWVHLICRAAGQQIALNKLNSCNVLDLNEFLQVVLPKVYLFHIDYFRSKKSNPQFSGKKKLR